ncbi:hypothetical protein KR074_011549, partial [Drosophila pseudoananassae]
MNERGFMHLSENCLELILDYSSFREHISFSQTCSRFRQVFGTWSRNKYTKVSIVGDVEEKELVLMSLVARDIKGLTIFVDDLVSSFQSLYKMRIKASLIKFCYLVRRMENLESVKIRQTNPHPITGNLLKALRDLPSLKQMNISTPSIKLTSLEMLRLTTLSSEDISNLYLKVIYACQNLRFLRILDNNISPKFIERVDDVLAQNEAKNKLTLLIHGIYTDDALR